MVVPAVDDSEWPIVRIVYPEEANLDDITILMRILDRIFETRGPMVVVADLTRPHLPDVTRLHLRKMAEGADKLADRGALLGGANIIRSPAMRLLFQAFLWLRTRTPYPILIFDDPAKAEAWARTIVAAKKR